ncbi:hypothetical protein ES705_14338 [subsurface metagenome]
MKRYILFLLALFTLEAGAQVKITGTVSNKKGEPIPGANIYFEGTYQGTTSDKDGNFMLNSGLTGKQKLVVSFIGYIQNENELDLNNEIPELVIELEETMSEINEVSITAGTFEAGDKKKSVLLKPFDIATTASAQGDIYGALATLPGAQKVGEEGRLFVRGGESYETKTFMDGMLVQSPYFSNLPDLPSRGRFSPLLFSGTLFSTGGYSAEFGQALSSIVDLTTNALEPEDKSSISLMTVGINASHVKRWKNTSLAITGDYLNTFLHNILFNTEIDWLETPVISGGTMMFKHKTGENGMIRSFCSYNYNSMSMRYDNVEWGIKEDISLINRNFYLNTTYYSMISEKWMLKTGIAYNRENENTGIMKDNIETLNSMEEIKISFTHFATDKIKFKFGGDLFHSVYRQQISMDGIYDFNFINNQFSGFFETDLTFSKKITFRIGGRTEYSSLLHEINLVPRISAAYKTGKYSQISMAYGKFHQNPLPDYLKIAPDLKTENAKHFILNYQYKTLLRTFRIEAYVKEYSDLVKYNTQYSIDPVDYSNNGNGKSKGIDVFWRDKQTFTNTDYWISYSFVTGKRNYKDYPESVHPHYLSNHNISFVYKRFFEKILTFGGFTYSFASGRPYNDPNSVAFMDSRTRPYHDLSFNLTHILQLFGKDAIFHLNFNNVFGFENVYGYNYSNTQNSDGQFESYAIKSPYKRQIVFLVSISF